MSFTKKDQTEVMSLPDHILQVLEENLNNGNNWMTASDISIEVMSNVRGRPQDKRLFRKIIQAKTIKSHMGYVRDLADAKGMTVVAERKFKNDDGDPLQGYHITAWRIATEEDIDYIQHELQLRATKEANLSNKRRKIRSTAKRKGLLPPELDEAKEINGGEDEPEDDD